MIDLDEQLERVAIQVAHLPDAEAQAIFDAERQRLTKQAESLARLEAAVETRKRAVTARRSKTLRP